MLIKATTSFAGVVSMANKETREVNDEVAKDLVKAGYAVVVTPMQTPSTTKTDTGAGEVDGTKRDNS